MKLMVYLFLLYYFYLFILYKTQSTTTNKLGSFIEMIRRANLEPTKKYKSPQTSSQEIGWITTPLVSCFTFFIFIIIFSITTKNNKKKKILLYIYEIIIN